MKIALLLWVMAVALLVGGLLSLLLMNHLVLVEVA